MGGLLALGALGAGAAGGAAATGAATAAGLGGLAGAGALGAGAAGATTAGLAGGATAAGLGAGTAAGLGAGAAGLGTTAAGLGAGGTLAGLGAGATTAGLAAPAAASIGTGLATPALATGAELGGLATGGLASSIGPGLGSAAAVGSELSKALIAAQTTAAGTAAQSAGIGTGLASATSSIPQAATGLAALPQVSPAIGGAVNPALTGMATKGALGTGLTSQGAMGTGLGSQGVMGAGQASTAASQLNAVAPTTSFSNTLSQAPQVFEGTLGKGLSTITPQAQAAQNISTQQLIAGAKSIYPNNPVMGKVATAQSMLESGLPGKGSSLATQGNNLFGIKGSGTAGSMNMPTKEFVGGRMVSQNAAFAKNASVSDSFAQHAKLMGNSRYSGVMNASNTQQATQALQKAGYATDPNYSSKLNSIIDRIGPAYDKASGISPQSMNTPIQGTNTAMNNQGAIPSIEGSPNAVRSVPAPANTQNITYPNQYVSKVSNLPGQGTQPQTSFLPKMANVKQDLMNPAKWANNSFQAQARAGRGPLMSLADDIFGQTQAVPGQGFLHSAADNAAILEGRVPLLSDGRPIGAGSGAGLGKEPTFVVQDAMTGRVGYTGGGYKWGTPTMDVSPTYQGNVYNNPNAYGQTETGELIAQPAQTPQQTFIQPSSQQQLEIMNSRASQDKLYNQMVNSPEGIVPRTQQMPMEQTYESLNPMERSGQYIPRGAPTAPGGGAGFDNPMTGQAVQNLGSKLGQTTGQKARGQGGMQIQGMPPGDLEEGIPMFGGAPIHSNQRGYYYQDAENFNEMYGQYYDFDEQ